MSVSDASWGYLYQVSLWTVKASTISVLVMIILVGLIVTFVANYPCWVNGWCY